MESRFSEQPAVRRVHALVNPASGGVGPGASEELATLFAELGLDHRVTELTSQTCEAAVRAAVAEAPDLIVALGGDGTARLVAEACGPGGPLVAPLSGGTMNVLGRALYGPVPWREALTGALAQGASRWVAGGEVVSEAGVRSFYCGAVLGAPALLAPAREAIRERALRRAWRRTVLSSKKAVASRLSYELGGRRGRGVAVSFRCPAAAGASANALNAAVLDPPQPPLGTRAGLRLAVRSLIGDWRDDPERTIACQGGRAWARRPIPIMLDGEFFRLGRSLEIRYRPRAFRALVPPAAEESAAADQNPSRTPAGIVAALSLGVRADL